MAIQPYFVFDGNCSDVLDWYEKAFGVTSKRMTFSEAPPNPDVPIPEEAKNRIMHATMEVEGTILMFSDTFPDTPHNPGSAITLAIVSNNSDNIRSYFDGLAEEGSVTMPLQETFWSPLYGQVTDRFGIEWQFSFQK